MSKPTIADLIHSQNAVLQRLGHEIRGEGGDWSARHMNSHTNKGGSHARSTHGNRGAVVERAVSQKVYEAFSAARTEQRTWFGTAERAYHQFVTS